MNSADILAFNLMLQEFLDSPSMATLENLAKAMGHCRYPTTYPPARTRYNTHYCIRRHVGDPLCIVCPLRHFEFNQWRKAWLCTTLENGVYFRESRHELHNKLTDITVAFMILRELMTEELGGTR